MMKRFLVLGCTFLLVGCGSDSREGLIDDAVGMINSATREVGTIKTNVNKAVEEVQSGKEPKLDLSNAMKSADQLKKIGEEAQKIKRRIEQERATITEEEKEMYFTKKRDDLRRESEALLKKHAELNKALNEAEQLSSSAKAEVEKLREKLTEAQSPFVALTRQ